MSEIALPEIELANVKLGSLEHFNSALLHMELYSRLKDSCWRSLASLSDLADIEL